TGGPPKTPRGAKAESEAARHDARRRCRAQKRRAWERNTRHRAHQLRRAAPPTRIVHGVVANLCTRHGREPLPGERQSRGFARRAGDAAAEIAQRLKVRPHQRVAGTYRRREQRRRRMGLSHGTLIPTDLTMSAQRAVSLSIKAWNCAGEAWDAVTPSGARRIANSSESRTAFKSPVRRAAIGGGRPAGAGTPPPSSTTRSMPPSPNVGILARVRSRGSLAIASARTRSRTELAVASVVKLDCT